MLISFKGFVKRRRWWTKLTLVKLSFRLFRFHRGELKALIIIIWIVICRLYCSLLKLASKILQLFKWFILLRLWMLPGELVEKKMLMKTNLMLCQKLIRMQWFLKLYRMRLGLNILSVMVSILHLLLLRELWWWINKITTATTTIIAISQAVIIWMDNQATMSTYKGQTLKVEK